MKRFIPTTIAGLAFLSVLYILSGCESKLSGEKGILEGIITIGPICPVVTDPPTADCLPTAETYKAYPVSIWTSDGKSRVALIDPALDGSFSMELNTGQYLIKREINSGVGGSNLPFTIVISSQEKTTVSIDIDTGIR